MANTSSNIAVNDSNFNCYSIFSVSGQNDDYYCDDSNDDVYPKYDDTYNLIQDMYIETY